MSPECVCRLPCPHPKNNKLAVSVAEDKGMWPPAASVQVLSPCADVPAMGNTSGCSSDLSTNQASEEGIGMAEGRQPSETKLR